MIQIACDEIPPSTRRVYSYPIGKQAVATAKVAPRTRFQRFVSWVLRRQWPLLFTFNCDEADDGRVALLTVENVSRFPQRVDAWIGLMPFGVTVSFATYHSPEIDMKVYQ